MGLPVNQSNRRSNLRDRSHRPPEAQQGDRSEICERLSRLVPLVALEGDRITEEFAIRHGLHRTDAQALSLLMDFGEQGQAVTAGLLSKELGLTSGATTFCIARLEKAGFAKRERDSADQRRVIISLSALGHDLALAFFRPVVALRDSVMNRFSTDELSIVQRFLSATTDAMTLYRTAHPTVEQRAGNTESAE